jgi:hypothetical protein
MTERKTIASLDRRPYFGIKAFVNNYLASFQPDCAKDVRLRSEPSAGNLEQTVQVVESNMKLQVLLDNILDRDWDSYRDAPRMVVQAGSWRRVRSSRRQCRVLEASYRSILICIFERKNAGCTGTISPLPSAPVVQAELYPRRLVLARSARNRLIAGDARG